MNNLTESDIKYLKNCVLHSTLLGHEVEKGNEVLRKLDQALNIANVAGQSEQLLALAKYMYWNFDDACGKTPKDYLDDFLSQ